MRMRNESKGSLQRIGAVLVEPTEALDDLPPERNEGLLGFLQLLHVIRVGGLTVEYLEVQLHAVVLLTRPDLAAETYFYIFRFISDLRIGIVTP